MCDRLTRRHFLLATGAMALGACTGEPRGLGDGIWYTVQPDDTLPGIARRHGSRMEAIIDANGLAGPGLRPGDRIFLPGGTVPAAPAAEEDPLAGLRAHDRGDYVLVERSSWTRRAPGTNHDPMNGIERITLHHTTEHGGMLGKTELEIVKAIAHHHRANLGWADIGYHYLIGRDGKVYEGRPASMQGAHSGGANNHHNLGISLIGDFENQRPTGRQERSLIAFLEDVQRRYGVRRKNLLGHRDLKHSTACPGDAGYRWLRDYAEGRL